METHKPRIHIDTADALPLIFETAGLTVQGLFADIGQVLINPRHETSTSMGAPSDAIEVKSKYDSYETDEYWLPRDANMVMCGTVAASSERLVTVSGDAHEDRPPMLFEGGVGELTGRFSRRANAATLVLVLLVVAAAAYLGAANYRELRFDESLLLLIGPPLLVVIAVAVVRHRWSL